MEPPVRGDHRAVIVPENRQPATVLDENAVRLDDGRRFVEPRLRQQGRVFPIGKTRQVEAVV